MFLTILLEALVSKVQSFVILICTCNPCVDVFTAHVLVHDLLELELGNFNPQNLD